MGTNFTSQATQAAKTVVVRMALSGILSALRKPLARAIHIPQKDIAAVCAVAQADADRHASLAGMAQPTPEMWVRAVELAYQQYVEDGIKVKAGG